MICLPTACYLVNLYARFKKINFQRLIYTKFKLLLLIKNRKSRMGYHALGSSEIWQLEQNSDCYYTVFDELTDVCMYLYVEVDLTRIHQYLEILILAPRLEGGHQVFGSLQEKIFKNRLGGQMFFQYMYPLPEAPDGNK